MKKLLYSLGIAAAIGLTANAAVPAATMQRIKSVDITKQKKITAAPQPVKAIPTTKKHVKGKVATANDFLGTYVWAGENLLGQIMFANEGTMTISLDPTNPDNLIISGFCQEGNLNSYVKNGRLYIPNQFSFFNQWDATEGWFWNYTVRWQFQNNQWAYWPYKNDVTEYYFQFDDEGYLIAGGIPDQNKWDNNEYTDEELDDLICIAADIDPLQPDAGFYWLCMWVQARKVNAFEYNEAEWTNIGTASFKDAWFPVMWDNLVTPPPYDVPVCRNVSNENLFLLMNPYGPDTPYGQGFNEASTGYIMIDITDPDCVYVKPLVEAGKFVLAQGSPAYPTFLFNAEGYFHDLQGASAEDIIVNFTNDGMKVSNFDPNDFEGPFVSIYNGYYAFQGGENTMVDPCGWLQGTDAQGNYVFYQLDGHVVLPNDYNAVKTVGVDENAAPVYYNLQGVKVNNPEKGQILIVKKGNQTTKQVIR